jgi:hypothetical protein
MMMTILGEMRRTRMIEDYDEVEEE